MSHAHRRRLLKTRGIPWVHVQYMGRVVRTFTRKRDGVVRRVIQFGTSPKRRVIWDKP